MVNAVIFIGMGVKITVYIGKYPETLFILLKYMQLLPKHPCKSLNQLIEPRIIGVLLHIGESGLPWAAFFQTALKLFLHNLNRMILVLLKTEYK